MTTGTILGVIFSVLSVVVAALLGHRIGFSGGVTEGKSQAANELYRAQEAERRRLAILDAKAELDAAAQKKANEEEYQKACDVPDQDIKEKDIDDLVDRSKWKQS